MSLQHSTARLSELAPFQWGLVPSVKRHGIECETDLKRPLTVAWINLAPREYRIEMCGKKQKLASFEKKTTCLSATNDFCISISNHYVMSQVFQSSLSIPRVFASRYHQAQFECYRGSISRAGVCRPPRLHGSQSCDCKALKVPWVVFWLKRPQKDVRHQRFNFTKLPGKFVYQRYLIKVIYLYLYNLIYLNLYITCKLIPPKSPESPCLRSKIPTGTFGGLESWGSHRVPWIQQSWKDSITS